MLKSYNIYKTLQHLTWDKNASYSRPDADLKAISRPFQVLQCKSNNISNFVPSGKLWQVVFKMIHQFFLFMAALDWISEPQRQIVLLCNISSLHSFIAHHALSTVCFSFGPTFWMFNVSWWGGGLKPGFREQKTRRTLRAILKQFKRPLLRSHIDSHCLIYCTKSP